MRDSRSGSARPGRSFAWRSRAAPRARSHRRCLPTIRRCNRIAPAGSDREARRRQAAAYFAERAATGIIFAHACAGARVERQFSISSATPAFIRSSIWELARANARIDRAARRARGRGRSEPAMLALARARSPRAAFAMRCFARRHLRAAGRAHAYELVVVHQVLHFLDDPSRHCARPRARCGRRPAAGRRFRGSRRGISARAIRPSAPRLFAGRSCRVPDRGGLVEAQTRLVAPATANPAS